MTQDQPVIRIGELLVQAGVITTYDLSEAEKLSSHMKVQFGRLLIMAGCLTEEALECALEAQGLIKEGVLTAQIACEALAFAVQENISLRQSLEALDCLPQFGTSTLRLAELIHDANIIDEERLHDAFDTSMETNRPLPEVLVEMECISPGLLSIMLRMQEQIRNETLDHEDSINELRGTFKIWKRADKAMANDPMSKSAIISAATPEKASRFTSSFDTVNRLPAISDEMLAGLNKESRVPHSPAASAQSTPSSSRNPAFAVPPPAPPVAPPPPSPPRNFQNAPAAYSNQNAAGPANPAGSASAPGAPNYSGSQGSQRSLNSSVSPAAPPANFPASPSQYPGQGARPANNAPPANSRPSPQNASASGGSDDLNVDWILNAPAGQPMPEEVILYSQGYFPPDPQKAGNKEAFSESFSDEDEQRINDLLDVFASDAPPAGPTVAGADRGGALKPGDPSRETNFAQASYSASLAAAAADGWGVPDLAAAGANLSGAEMFARAQAELASGGWAYGPGTASPSVHKFSSPDTPSATPGSNAPADSTRGAVHSDAAKSPAAFSGASQPLTSPAAPTSTSGPGTPPVSTPPITPASAATPTPPSPTLSPAATPVPTPGPLGQPTFVTPLSPTPAPAQPAPPQSPPPVPSRPDVPAAPSAASMPSAPPSPATVTPEVAKTHAAPAESSASPLPGSSSIAAPSPWAPPPSLAPSNASGPSKSALPTTPSARNLGTDTIEDSLFSPTFKESISDALQANPFKIRKVAEADSSTISTAVPAESKPTDSETEVEALVEAKTIDNQKTKSADETEAKADSEAEQHQDAKSKSEGESKFRDDSQAANALAAPRGKFGTKTGLAAKRKASEGSDEPAERNDVVFLLKSADFFSADELEDAIVSSLRDQNKAIEMLGILGIIDKSNLDAAVRLQKLVKAGSVDVSKAIESLTDLKSGKLRASELTEQLGIKKPKRRK